MTNVDEKEKQRVVRVYCDGIYDLFHSGHSKQFQQVHEHKQLEGFAQVQLIVGGKSVPSLLSMILLIWIDCRYIMLNMCLKSFKRKGC